MGKLDIRSYYRPTPKRGGEIGRTTPAIRAPADRDYLDWYLGLCHDVLQNDNASAAFAEMLALYAGAKGYQAPPDRI